MKKVKQIVILVVCVLMLSGCIKERINMSIGKDKSMTLKLEALISDKLSDSMGESTDMDAQAEEAKKKGYSIEKKTEDGYSGYVISKKFSNIDELSKNNGEEVELGDLFDSFDSEKEDSFDMSKLFKVEKGFLKNTYTAKFTFENTTSSGDDSTLNLDEDDEVVTTEALEKSEDEITTEAQTEDETGIDDGTSSDDQLGELMLLAGEMEFTYSVNLPYGAKTNNATKVSADKKTLTWNLATSGKSTIEYSFEMYNITNLIIIGAAALVVIVIVIIIILKASKKKDSSKETLIHTDYDSSIVGQIDETVAETDEMAQANQKLEYTMPQTPITTAPSVPSESPVVAEPQAPVQPEVPVAPAATSPAPQAPTQNPVVNNNPQIDTPNMVQFTDNNQNN